MANEEEQLTPEEQAEQERLERERQSEQRPQIHSRPRELAKKAKNAYKQGQEAYRHGREFIQDPKAKARELGQMAKDRAMQPVRNLQQAGQNTLDKGRRAVDAARNAPKNIANKGRQAAEAIRNAPQNVAKKAKDTIESGKKVGRAIKNTPQNIKKGADAVKAGAQAVKLGLQAGKAAGGLLTKTGAKAALGTAVGAGTAGIGTAVLAAGDAAIGAAKAGIKAGRKVLKQFNADLIGKIEDKIWDAVTSHFKKYWKAYLAGSCVMPVLIFVTAFMIIFLVFNASFDKDSPAGQANITAFQDLAESNIAIPDDQKNELVNQVKEGLVNPRLLKFLIAIGKNHTISISAIREEVEDEPNMKFNPIQINIDSVDAIKCTNTESNYKYAEYPISLKQNFDWKSFIPDDDNLKDKVVCAIGYYPLIEEPKTSADSKIEEIFSPGEFQIKNIATAALAAAQVKIAELLVESDNLPEDSEGITIAPVNIELGADLSEKNLNNPADVSLKTFFKARNNKNLEEISSLFKTPSSLNNGALVFFL